MSQSPSSLSPATASSSGVNSPLDQPPLPPRVVKVIAAMDVENVNEGKSDVLKRNHIVPRVFD